jgi:hypothetical protein
MASNQRNHWSNRRGARAPNGSPVPAAQASPNHLGQWRQTYERYKGLAESAGDTDAVTREGYWQHAEHFIRLINEAEAARQPG